MSFLDWLGVTVAAKSPEVGDAAPEIVSRDELGREVSLADLYREGIVLVYFYPKADTPGCTVEACSLRDDFAALTDRGVRIVGVSADGPVAQMRFKEKHQLPFTLLADHDRIVARAFGVRLILGMPHRQSFLIKGGRVVWRDLHASTGDQARDVLKALES
jgi:peroxiredoxin Q/BCP